jgi:hypothetical protein
MRVLIAVVSLAVLLATPAGTQPPAAATHALTGVTIVDGTGATGRPLQKVRMAA